MATPLELEKILASEINSNIFLRLSAFQLKPTTALVKKIARRTKEDNCLPKIFTTYCCWLIFFRVLYNDYHVSLISATVFKIYLSSQISNKLSGNFKNNAIGHHQQCDSRYENFATASLKILPITPIGAFLLAKTINI